MSNDLGSSEAFKIKSFKSRFNELQDTHCIVKAKEYSRWTVPYLMAMPETDGKQSTLDGDFQSVGALLVNSLSSKLAGLLFPSNYPFMQLSLSIEGRKAMEEFLEQSGYDKSQLSNLLTNLTTDASQKAFTGSSFFQLVLACKHLIVTGNVAIRRNEEENSLTCFGLNDFVVRRDGLGRVVEAILKESLYFGTLPEDVQNYVRIKGHYGADTPQLRNKSIDKYTRVYLDGNYYVEEVGIDNIILNEEFVTTYERKKLPYIFPTWTLVNREHYGRSLVEDLKGDFSKLSTIAESLTLYEIESLRVVYGVSADSFDAIDELITSATGDYVRVSQGAVSVIETGSAQKVQQIKQDLDDVFTRLARAMMWRSNTRDGERVTAYEIRQEIEEVEASMGGAYSSLSESLQLPLSYLFLFETDEQLMNSLVDTDVGHVSITAGMNALNKNTKAQRVLEAIMEAGQAVETATQIDRRIDPTRIVDLFFEAKGIDFSEIAKSDEELQAEQEAEIQQAQAEQMMAQGQDAGNTGGQGQDLAEQMDSLNDELGGL